MLAQCPQCGTRIGWKGTLQECPPCPKCGQVISFVEYDLKELEDFKEFLRTRKENNVNRATDRTPPDV